MVFTCLGLKQHTYYCNYIDEDNFPYFYENDKFECLFRSMREMENFLFPFSQSYRNTHKWFGKLFSPASQPIFHAHFNSLEHGLLLIYFLHCVFSSLVPCLPPQYVTYDVPGLTMLLAKWQPVPEHCRNGVILGYRVKYQRLDGASPARIENTTADLLYAFLYDMDIYANYSIEISAFTRKGEGNATLDLALPDTLGKCFGLHDIIIHEKF